ncbi:relaxase/mobilization nuclease domain-containing protein [Delftia tsuruhatensis]|uniref:relaxase/mobilization nuclease domain-containing protein n=1 Tax=Delftia tsuruhatensis TaxID=180282 RepID=UPI003A88A2D7
MLIKIFKRVGKGSSRGPISYLLGKDKDGKPREPAPVELNQLLTSEGSKDAVAFLIDSNKRANKYTSGVIAFRDNEKLRPTQIQEVIQDFRKTFLPGLDENNVPVLWVMHRNEGNIELHFLVPKQEATTGKAFNIAPPGPASKKLFADFQKMQNDKLGFKQVTPNFLTAQFDTFEKRTRKGNFSAYLVEKVKSNEIHNRADLLRHLQHKLKWKVTRIGEDYISVIPTGKDKPIRLKGPAFTAKADYRDMLKQASNQPTKLNPDELLKIDKSLQNGTKARTSYNLKNYINPPNYKSRGLNFKGKTQRNDIKKSCLGAVSAQQKAPLGEQVSDPQPSKTSSVEFSSSTLPNTSTKQEKTNLGRSGGSPSGSGGSSGGGTSSIDAQISSVKAQMNSEKNPAKRAQLHTQLLALQVKKEQMLLQQHNDRLKQLNKIKP